MIVYVYLRTTQHLAGAQDGAARDTVQLAKLADCGALAARNLGQRISLLNLVEEALGRSTLLIISLIFMESIGVGHNVLLFKIEHQRGIQRFAQEARLEVQVRPGGASGITSQRDGFARLHQLVNLHQLFGQMTIDGLQTIVVADDHIFAITAASLILHHTHFSVECRADGIAHVHLDVQPIVSSASARTIAEHVGYLRMLCGHAEAGKIKSIGFGENDVFISNHLVIPRGVYVEGGIEGLFNADLLLESQGVDGLQLPVDGSLAGNEVLRKGIRAEHRHCSQTQSFNQGQFHSILSIFWGAYHLFVIGFLKNSLKVTTSF